MEPRATARMTDNTRGAELPSAEPPNTGTEATRTAAETEATTGTNEATTGTSEADDRIEARLSAVERAVTGNDARPVDAAPGAEATAERERLESRLDDLEERVAELEAATQAVRGYAGAVRAVNREIERRADLALARATEAGRESDRDGGGNGAGRGASDGAGRAASGGAGRDGGSGAPDRGARDRDGPDGAVPSESALDAALPDDRPTSGPRTGNGDPDGDDGDGDDNAWATDALDRLRESL